VESKARPADKQRYDPGSVCPNFVAASRFAADSKGVLFVEQADHDRLWKHGRPLCNVSVKSDFFEDIWASP
jgi:hypothetical protein